REHLPRGDADGADDQARRNDRRGGAVGAELEELQRSGAERVLQGGAGDRAPCVAGPHTRSSALSCPFGAPPCMSTAPAFRTPAGIGPRRVVAPPRVGRITFARL